MPDFGRPLQPIAASRFHFTHKPFSRQVVTAAVQSMIFLRLSDMPITAHILQNLVIFTLKAKKGST